MHLYEERGDRLVDELRGMFAFALWDSRKRRLVLARDRFGIKPLYYGTGGGWLSFASELKALVRRPGFSTEVDLDALEAFLAFNSIPAPLTIFRLEKPSISTALCTEFTQSTLKCDAGNSTTCRSSHSNRSSRAMTDDASRSSRSILASASSSGCRTSMLIVTWPGMTLREFGLTCMKPTVARPSGACRSAIALTASTILDAPRRAS